MRRACYEGSVMEKSVMGQGIIVTEGSGMRGSVIRVCDGEYMIGAGDLRTQI